MPTHTATKTLVQFTIGESGHEGFPLQAIGLLLTPCNKLPIVECGRNRAEVLERVFKFAAFHTQHS